MTVDGIARVHTARVIDNNSVLLYGEGTESFSLHYDTPEIAQTVCNGFNAMMPFDIEYIWERIGNKYGYKSFKIILK